MNFSRLSLVLVAFGAVSFAIWDEDLVIPLNLVWVYFVGLGVFGGGLFACLGVLQRWKTPNARSNLLVEAAWTIVSIAMIVSIGSFLVLTQTVSTGACSLAGYYVSMYAGLTVAAAALSIIVHGSLRR